MKKILAATLMSATVATSLSALTYEYPQLYKDPKVMGMGGANVAVGGDASAVFYNPAGLSYIPREYGVELGLINVNLSTNENVLDFANDLADSTDAPGDLDGDGIEDEDDDQTLAALDVFESYTGKNIHFDANNFSSISRKGEKIAFALGAVAGATLDARTHRGFGADGVMEIQALGYYGAVFGISNDFSNVEIADKYILNDFSIGLGIKQINYYSVDHAFTVTEYIDNKDDFGQYLVDNVAEQGTSMAYDIGGTYKLNPNWIAGMSVLNIGGIGDENAVYIPQTINAGVGYLKRWEGKKLFNQLRFAADYIDIAKGYEQDSDIIKRTRLGAGLNVWDGWFSTLQLRGGLYQGAPTYGLNFRLMILEVGYAMYSEEVGAYGGQDKDTRHLVNLKIGW